MLYKKNDLLVCHNVDLSKPVGGIFDEPHLVITQDVSDEIFDITV